MNDTAVLVFAAEAEAFTGLILWLVISGGLFLILFVGLVFSCRVPPGGTVRPDATGPPHPEFNFTDHQRWLLRRAVRDVARRTRRGDVTWRFESDDEERTNDE